MLRQWGIAGHPVPPEWADRAVAALRARSADDVYERLFAELPPGPGDGQPVS